MIPSIQDTGDPRSPRRQEGVLHVYDCGPRAVLELLIEVEKGTPLNTALRDYERVSPDVFYAAILLGQD